jgi:outer membrane PBP1 activator LpoA protein
MKNLLLLLLFLLTLLFTSCTSKTGEQLLTGKMVDRYSNGQRALITVKTQRKNSGISKTAYYTIAIKNLHSFSSKDSIVTFKRRLADYKLTDTKLLYDE